MYSPSVTQVDINAVVQAHGTGVSPLMLAIQFRRDTMVRHLLMARDIDLHYRNSLKQTAVLFAVRNNDIELVNLLLGAQEADRTSGVCGTEPLHPCALLEAIKQGKDDYC